MQPLGCAQHPARAQNPARSRSWRTWAGPLAGYAGRLGRVAGSPFPRELSPPSWSCDTFRKPSPQSYRRLREFVEIQRSAPLAALLDARRQPFIALAARRRFYRHSWAGRRWSCAMSCLHIRPANQCRNPYNEISKLAFSCNKLPVFEDRSVGTAEQKSILKASCR